MVKLHGYNLGNKVPQCNVGQNGCDWIALEKNSLENLNAMR